MAVIGHCGPGGLRGRVSLRIVRRRRGVFDRSGFEIGAANELTGTEPPGERELQVLREDVDPHGYVIGR